MIWRWVMVSGDRIMDRSFKKAAKPSFYRDNQDCNSSKSSRTKQSQGNQVATRERYHSWSGCGAHHGPLSPPGLSTQAMAATSSNARFVLLCFFSWIILDHVLAMVYPYRMSLGLFRYLLWSIKPQNLHSINIFWACKVKIYKHSSNKQNKA